MARVAQNAGITITYNLVRRVDRTAHVADDIRNNKLTLWSRQVLPLEPILVSNERMEIHLLSYREQI